MSDDTFKGVFGQDKDSDIGQFIGEYMTYLSDNTTTPKCPGDLEVTKSFTISKLENPAAFLSNLLLLGIDCDCKFVQSLGGIFGNANSPYRIDYCRKNDNGFFDIQWSLEGFRQLLTALRDNQAIGIQIKGIGYFPPMALKELVVNVLQGHSTHIVVRKGYFGQNE